MADEIIDLSRIIEQRSDGRAPPGTMSLWGADGERSRFGLPLWRMAHLAGAERGVIFWLGRGQEGDSTPRPWIVLDTASDPARTELPVSVAACGAGRAAELHDLGAEGLLVCLGERDGRMWGILADGRRGASALTSRQREDILFLAGECAGLLFLRDLADGADG